MALCKLERRNYGGKWPVSIIYQNLNSFKEGLILLCQSILETRRITHLHGLAHFTIPLTYFLALMPDPVHPPSKAFVFVETIQHLKQMSWVSWY